MSGPALLYYRANEGSWAGTFRLRVTDAGALRAERGWLEAWSWRLLALLPGLRMRTTVTVRSETEVGHTTRLSWGPVAMMWGEEELVLDGASVTMEGWNKTVLGQTDQLRATATVSEDGMRAEYALTWLGMAVRQTGERLEGGEAGVVLRQWGPGFESEVELRGG